MSKFNDLTNELCTNGVEYKTLGDVAVKIFSGKNKEKNQQGTYPVYGSTGVIAYCEKYEYDKKQILIARVGANAGYVHIAEGRYDVSDNTIILDVKDNVLFKYIYYLLADMDLNRYAKGGGQPLITAGQIKELKIPIPPLEVQCEIVCILDKFTDYIDCLEKEHELRKKQYEYYRKKLLTFREMKL
ncbi:MAG: restriction endonuclease subunit S [Ruminococcus sp.]|nr:restriction endonuclease subunit S [Ruminococcus sp.]